MSERIANLYLSRQGKLLSGDTFTFLCLVILGMFVQSCNSPESYPDKPAVSFEQLRFIPTNQQDELGIQSFDTLSLTFSFTDGDGNLGLSNDEKFDPFHDFDIVVDHSDTTVVTFSSSNDMNQLIQYKRENTGNNVGWQGSPRNPISFARKPDFDCVNYEIMKVRIDKTGLLLPEAPQGAYRAEDYVTDTVLVVRNIYRNNIYVFFETDVNEKGTFVPLDWEYLFDQYGCGLNFHARFPQYSPALEGTVTYNMGSLGFKTRLGKGQFRLKFFIIDRNLNISDTITTPAIRLSDITQGSL